MIDAPTAAAIEGRAVEQKPAWSFENYAFPAKA
jgi:hypothetical protein